MRCARVVLRCNALVMYIFLQLEAVLSCVLSFRDLLRCFMLCCVAMLLPTRFALRCVVCVYWRHVVTHCWYFKWFWSVLRSFALLCIALLCVASHHIALMWRNAWLYCIDFNRVVLFCFVVYCIVLYRFCLVMYFMLSYFFVLRCVVLYCIRF